MWCIACPCPTQFDVLFDHFLQSTPTRHYWRRSGATTSNPWRNFILYFFVNQLVPLQLKLTLCKKSKLVIISRTTRQKGKKKRGPYVYFFPIIALTRSVLTYITQTSWRCGGWARKEENEWKLKQKNAQTLTTWLRQGIFSPVAFFTCNFSSPGLSPNHVTTTTPSRAKSPRAPVTWNTTSRIGKGTLVTSP